jgi:hypothetical protein
VKFVDKSPDDWEDAMRSTSAVLRHTRMSRHGRRGLGRIVTVVRRSRGERMQAIYGAAKARPDSRGGWRPRSAGTA